MRECVGNKQDFDATLLARCKGDSDSYQKLINYLLYTQGTWAFSKDYRKSLYKIANEHGISSEQYDLCLKDDIKSQIPFEHAKLLASDAAFLGTPCFYINGTLFKIDELSEAIEIQLIKRQEALALDKENLEFLQPAPENSSVWRSEQEIVYLAFAASIDKSTSESSSKNGLHADNSESQQKHIQLIKEEGR